MNITIFIGALEGGGAERVCCNLANHLTRQGHQVTMLLMQETKGQYPLDSGVKKVFLTPLSEKYNKLRTNYLRYKRLRQYVKTADADCFVVMLPVTTALLLHLKKQIKGRVIASERTAPTNYSGLKQSLLRHYAPRADGWVFQTEEARSWYGDLAKNAAVIPNAINPDFLLPPYTGEREKTVAAAGRLSREKNFKLLLETFAKISPKHPDYRLKIYGKGPLEQELREQAQALGIADRVDFMGYVNHMEQHLQKAAAFVLSSDCEGMPNALMEAMALGLPCVSTDCPTGGPGFLINNGENGLLVPVGDVNAMAAAMCAVLEDTALAQKLGQNARTVANDLSPDRIYSRWAAFIADTVKKT